ncbi:MAG TPA: ABC transporter ATP-binding protein [Gemmatimonadaceae bacterium]|nr:ABC transporter ATP-binding protein [Gemmatimonadaceae bacterium]
MLEIRNLTKRFGALDVLRGVDLAVRPGRITALVGPNGAGKTTLIKSVLGLTRPDGGAILLGGQPAVGDAYRARIGYMPQIAHFPGNLSGADLMAMLGQLRGVAPGGPDTDEELVERFALAPELDRPLHTLSGGTRQKVNAVLAFLFRPELLVLDEPTAGLDPIASGLLKDRIVVERGRGRTVLLTSHVSSELEELADDVGFLLDGRVVFAGPVDELLRRTEQPRLERAIAHVMQRRATAGGATDAPAAADAADAADALEAVA